MKKHNLKLCFILTAVLILASTTGLFAPTVSGRNNGNCCGNDWSG